VHIDRAFAVLLSDVWNLQGLSVLIDATVLCINAAGAFLVCLGYHYSLILQRIMMLWLRHCHYCNGCMYQWSLSHSGSWFSDVMLASIVDTAESPQAVGW